MFPDYGLDIANLYSALSEKSRFHYSAAFSDHSVVREEGKIFKLW